eukprot:scaffold48861_cov19-Tisochrysis_lutea.AAC.1
MAVQVDDDSLFAHLPSDKATVMVVSQPPVGVVRVQLDNECFFAHPLSGQATGKVSSQPLQGQSRYEWMNESVQRKHVRWTEDKQRSGFNSAAEAPGYWEAYRGLTVC